MLSREYLTATFGISRDTLISPRVVEASRQYFIRSLRLVAELKFVALFALCATDVTYQSRAVADEARCVAQTASACTAGTVCLDRLTCIAELKQSRVIAGVGGWYMGSGLGEWDDYYRMNTVWFLTLLNALVTTLLVFHREDAGGKWKRSDIALCFKLNQHYQSRSVRIVRRANIAIILVAVLASVFIAYRRGTVYLLLYELHIEIIGLIIAVDNMHSPADELDPDKTFEFYEHSLTTFPFEWGDLWSSAPSLLTKKMTSAAREEFKSIDTNKDGFISPEEVLEAAKMKRASAGDGEAAELMS